MDDIGRKLGDKRTDRVDRTHIFIATPAYDGKVDSVYCQSLAETSFCAPLYQIYITASVMANGAFIDLARNVFIKMFLEKFTDASHIFFIDSDLKFEPRAFVMLAKANLPIAAGVYRRRQEEEDYPAQWTPHPDGGGLWVEETEIMNNPIQLVMHKRVPTGFLCIRRDIVEEMAKDAIQMNIHGQDGVVPRLFYTKINDENRFVGEDFAFCDDYVAKYKRNIPVLADCEFTHGGKWGNYAKWMTRKIEENDAREAAKKEANSEAAVITEEEQ